MHCIYKLYFIYIYILIELWSPSLYVCLFEAVHTNPGYEMAPLISNNLATQFNLGHSNTFKE